MDGGASDDVEGRPANGSSSSSSSWVTYHRVSPMDSKKTRGAYVERFNQELLENFPSPRHRRDLHQSLVDLTHIDYILLDLRPTPTRCCHGIGDSKRRGWVC